jgi:hypothetical protein
MQRMQKTHDTAAHADILALVVPRRLTHFTLHFAKYQGSLVHAERVSDVPLKFRVLTDSAIIVLAAANALNIDLASKSASESRNQQRRRRGGDLLGEYIETVGRMAKACEALDHLEDYPFRTVMETAVCDLLDVVCELADRQHLGLKDVVTKRWAEVESRSQNAPLDRHGRNMTAVA